MDDRPAVHDTDATFDEVGSRRALKLVREAGIEAPCGELRFNAAEWLREIELDGPWRPSVMKVAKVLAKLFGAPDSAAPDERGRGRSSGRRRRLRGRYRLAVASPRSSAPTFQADPSADICLRLPGDRACCTWLRASVSLPGRRHRLSTNS